MLQKHIFYIEQNILKFEMDILNFYKNLYDRLHATNVENANANVDENTFSGREKEASSDLQKYLAFNAGGVK